MEEDNKATKEDLESFDGALERAGDYLGAVSLVAINVEDTASIKFISAIKLSEMLEQILKARKACSIELADWDKMQSMTGKQKLDHVLKQLK